jgi:hypothetical protein
MKHFLATFLVLLGFSFSSPSKAMIGLGTSDSALVVAGLVMMDLSQITVWERRDDVRRDRYGRVRVYSYYTYRVITYPALLLAGLVILDSEGQLKLAADLPADVVAKAELTEAELASFQENIEEINLLLETITFEVSHLGSEEEKIEAAGQLWSEYAEFLDLDAAVALKKIGLAL